MSVLRFSNVWVARLTVSVRCPVRALLTVAMMLSVAGHANDSSVITPSCAEPARLEGQFDPAAPHLVVVLKADVQNSQAVAVALSRKYGFSLRWVFRTLKGFAASLLTPAELARLRCEPEVEVVSYDQQTTISAR